MELSKSGASGPFVVCSALSQIATTSVTSLFSFIAAGVLKNRIITLRSIKDGFDKNTLMPGEY